MDTKTERLLEAELIFLAALNAIAELKVEVLHSVEGGNIEEPVRIDKITFVPSEDVNG